MYLHLEILSLEYFFGEEFYREKMSFLEQCVHSYAKKVNIWNIDGELIQIKFINLNEIHGHRLRSMVTESGTPFCIDQRRIRMGNLTSSFRLQQKSQKNKVDLTEFSMQ